MDRRLAAILAADVVGYSALMEADEAGTFARLKAHRTELFEPEAKLHHGRIFKLMGDGVLAEPSGIWLVCYSRSVSLMGKRTGRCLPLSET